MNKSKIYIIAEIGNNHEGSFRLAKKLIQKASEAGVDAVKFQTFKAENLVSRETPKVRYQLSTTNDKESHYEMIENLEFKYEDHLPVMKYCIKQDIDFISTPYDIESAKFLNEIGVEVFKTASADIVDIPLHKFIASTKKEVIISVGMATYKEIEDGQGTLSIVTSLQNKENTENLIPEKFIGAMNYRCIFPIQIRKNLLNADAPIITNVEHKKETLKGQFSFTKANISPLKISDKGVTYNPDGSPSGTIYPQAPDENPN